MFPEFWWALAQEFKIKDLGEVEQYVGIKVARDRKAGTMELSQSELLEEVLMAHGKLNVTPRKTPLNAGEIL